MPTTTIEKPIEKPKATTPWKPANLMDAAKRDGYRRRWTNVDLLDKRIQEGWTTVQSKSASPIVTLLDGTQLTNTVRKRNLILMEIPEKTACEIEEYYRNLGDQNLQAGITEFQNKIPNAFGDGIKDEK